MDPSWISHSKRPQMSRADVKSQQKGCCVVGGLTLRPLGTLELPSVSTAGWFPRFLSDFPYKTFPESGVVSFVVGGLGSCRDRSTQGRGGIWTGRCRGGPPGLVRL